MPDLADFQRDFASALISDGRSDRPFCTPAFAVYRNTAARGLVEALRDSYPTVDMLLGEEMFTQLALDFRLVHPPAGPVLSEFGREFPDYLAAQPWTSELPYLADVARLDLLWLESFLAADLDYNRREPSALPRIMLHPAARFAWFATPAMTIWQAHRETELLTELEPEWREEGALFTRPGSAVLAQPIDIACYRLLLACARPTSVDDCVSSVAQACPHSNVPELLQQCLTAGALTIY